MEVALFVFAISFSSWVFVEFWKGAKVWVRFPVGLAAFGAFFVFSFYAFQSCFGYIIGNQTIMIQSTSHLASETNPETAVSLLDRYIPQIKECKMSSAQMHRILVEFMRDSDDLQRNYIQQSSPPNHRPSGTSGTSPAEQALVPEASGGR